MIAMKTAIPQTRCDVSVMKGRTALGPSLCKSSHTATMSSESQLQ